MNIKSGSFVEKRLEEVITFLYVILTGNSAYFMEAPSFNIYHTIF